MSFINNKLQHKLQSNTFKNQMAHLMHLTFPWGFLGICHQFRHSTIYTKCIYSSLLTMSFFRLRPSIHCQHTITMPYALKLSPEICPLYFLTNTYTLAMFLTSMCLPTYYSSRALETKPNASIATTPLRC